MYANLIICENKTGYDIDTNIIIENNLKYPNINFINNLDEINREMDYLSIRIYRLGLYNLLRFYYITKFIDGLLNNNKNSFSLSLPNI